MFKNKNKNHDQKQGTNSYFSKHLRNQTHPVFFVFLILSWGCTNFDTSVTYLCGRDRLILFRTCSRMNARMCNLRSQPVATLPRSSDVSDTSVIGFWTEQMKLIGMRSLSLGLIGSLGAEPKTLVVIYLSPSSIHLTTDRRPKGTVSLALHHRHRASADFC